MTVELAPTDTVSTSRLDAIPPDKFASIPKAGVRQELLVLILLAGIASLALFLRTDNISRASYWFDESSSWKTIQFGWGEMLQPISRNVHPPVFYYALKGWAAIFGDGPVSLRLFSALLGVATVLATYRLTLEIIAPASETKRSAVSEQFTGLFAATLVALSAMHVMLGLNARMYTLTTLLAVLCATFLVRIMRSGGSVWDWSAAAITGTLLTLTHYYGLFTAAALGMALLICMIQELIQQGWSAKLKRLLLGSLLSGWIVGNVWGLWFPFFEAQRSQVTADYFIPDFKWQQLAHVCSALLSAPEVYGNNSPLVWLAVEFWGVVCMLVAWLGGSVGRLVALAAVLPFGVAIYYSWHGQSIFLLRHFLTAQLFLLIGWAVLVHRLRWRPLQIVLWCGSIAWLSFWTSEHLSHRHLQCEHSDLKNVAVVLDEWRGGKEIVIVGSSVIHPTILQYAQHRDQIYVLDRGYRYPHYQGDPILRNEEYFPLSRLESMPIKRLFVVDVYDLYHKGSRYEVELPAEWELVRSQWFAEQYVQPCRIFLREYRRQKTASALAEARIVAGKRAF